MRTSLSTRLGLLFRRASPVRVLVFGYLVYLCVGWALLSLPIAWESGDPGALDNLFTATSAVSTTGLATIATGSSYSLFGEAVVLLLIQAGGLGFMTFGSFVLLATRTRLSRWREGISRTEFSLPPGFSVPVFLRRVVLFTLSVEAIGAGLLFLGFQGSEGLRTELGEAVGAGQVAWFAVFHSVSAFCTAGFSIFGSSLEAFRDDVFVNVVISALALTGAVGFIVLSDWAGQWAGERRRMTLTSRIILWATGWLVAGSAGLLFLFDPALGVLAPESRLLASLFQAMTAVTTVGFNTVPISALGYSSVLVCFVVMVIGASPAGTGGGLKSTTATAVVAAVRSTLRGDPRVTFLGRILPEHRLHAALAALGFYIATLLVGTFLLLLSDAAGPDGLAFDALLFEASSALGTVGLSRGITGDLSVLGKLVIVVLMFLGRLGPLTFGLAFLARPRRSEEAVEEDFVV